MTPDQKKDFLTQILRQHEHKVIVTNMEVPYFDKAAFKQAGFMGETRTRMFFGKALTEKANVVNKMKFKRFSIKVLNFSI